MDEFTITAYEQKDPTTGKYIVDYLKPHKPEKDEVDFKSFGCPITKWSLKEWKSVDQYGVIAPGTMETFKNLEKGIVTGNTCTGYTAAEIQCGGETIIALFKAKVAKEDILALVQKQKDENVPYALESSSSNEVPTEEKSISGEESEDEDSKNLSALIKATHPLSNEEIEQKLCQMFYEGNETFSFKHPTTLPQHLGEAYLFFDRFQKEVCRRSLAGRVSFGRSYDTDDGIGQVLTIKNEDGKLYIPTCGKHLPPGFYETCGFMQWWAGSYRAQPLICTDCAEKRSRVYKGIIDVHIRTVHYQGGFIVTCTKRYPKVTDKVTVSTQTGDESQVDKQGQGGSKRQRKTKESQVDKQGQGGSKRQREMQEESQAQKHGERSSTRQKKPIDRYAPPDEHKDDRYDNF